MKIVIKENLTRVFRPPIMNMNASVSGSRCPVESVGAISSWECRAREFARNRDHIAGKYRYLRREASKLSNDTSTTSDTIPTDTEDFGLLVDELFIETLDFLHMVIQTGIEETKAGRCFRLKVQIIKFIIRGIIESDSVEENDSDYSTILHIVGTHFGRLTLDPYGGWDKVADIMDAKADDIFADYMEISKRLALAGQDVVLWRDMGWLRDCWYHVNWYDPECDCPPCSSRAQMCPFREMCWGKHDGDIVDRLESLPAAETLGPLEVWKDEMNDRLGETF